VAACTNPRAKGRQKRSTEIARRVSVGDRKRSSIKTLYTRNMYRNRGKARERVLLWYKLAQTPHDDDNIEDARVTTAFTRRARRYYAYVQRTKGGSIAEWLACWTQAQKGPGSNRSRVAVGQQSLANCSHPLYLGSPSSKTGSSPVKDCGGNFRPGEK